MLLSPTLPASPALPLAPTTWPGGRLGPSGPVVPHAERQGGAVGSGIWRAPPALDGSRAALHLIVNQRSGSAGQLADSGLWGRRALGRHALHWHCPHRAQELSSVARQAVQQARRTGGIVVAVGGDGTINTVANDCWSAGVPMGVLASGTFNFFARQHGLGQQPQESLDAIVQALDDAQLQPVQVGLVNGQVFLVNASLGLYPRLLAEREAATRRWGRHQLVAMGAGVRSLLHPLPAARYRLTWLSGHGQVAEREQVEASTLFVGNNALQLQKVGLPDTEVVGGGSLQAVTLAAATRWSMARLLWRAAAARLAEEPLIHSRVFTGLVVDRIGGGAGGPVRVAFDGERTWMHLPLRFEVGEQPLWLVGAQTPRPATAQTDEQVDVQADPQAVGDERSAANGSDSIPAFGEGLATSRSQPQVG